MNISKKERILCAMGFYNIKFENDKIDFSNFNKRDRNHFIEYVSTLEVDPYSIELVKGKITFLAKFNTAVVLTQVYS